jgi:hypothetical protein
MELIANLFASIMILPVFVPFLMFILVYYALIFVKRSKKKDALTSAANVTTFFLLIAIIMMEKIIKMETFSTLRWILLFFFITSCGIGILQYTVKGKVNLPKLTRATWRIAFVFFAFLYFVLFFEGIHYFLQQV